MNSPQTSKVFQSQSEPLSDAILRGCLYAHFVGTLLVWLPFCHFALVVANTPFYFCLILAPSLAIIGLAISIPLTLITLIVWHLLKSLKVIVRCYAALLAAAPMLHLGFQILPIFEVLTLTDYTIFFVFNTLVTAAFWLAAFGPRYYVRWAS